MAKQQEISVTAEKDMSLFTHRLGKGVKAVKQDDDFLVLINPVNKSQYKLQTSLYKTNPDTFLEEMRMINDGRKSGEPETKK